MMGRKWGRQWPAGSVRVNRIVLASLALAGIVLSVPSVGADTTGANTAGEDTAAVATVNGEAIGNSELQVMMGSIMNGARPTRRSDIDDAQTLAREQLIVNLAEAQAATQLGLLNDPGIKGVLAYQRALILSRAYIKEMLRRDPVTDERLKQEYEFGLNQGRAQEFHIAHMVVAQKTRAEELLAALGRGEAFDSLARLHSQDGSASTNSGDLGWIRIDLMDELRFVVAVKSLKAGEYTHAPVKGPTGWHIIKLIEAPRALDATIPYADLSAEAKDKLRSRAVQRQVEQIEKQVVSKATITRSTGLVSFVQSPEPAAAVEAPAKSANDKSKAAKPAKVNPPAH